MGRARKGWSQFSTVKLKALLVKWGFVVIEVPEHYTSMRCHNCAFPLNWNKGLFDKFLDEVKKDKPELLPEETILHLTPALKVYAIEKEWNLKDSQLVDLDNAMGTDGKKQHRHCTCKLCEERWKSYSTGAGHIHRDINGALNILEKGLMMLIHKGNVPEVFKQKSKSEI